MKGKTPKIREDLSPKSMKTKPQKDKSKFIKHIYNTKKWKDLRNSYIEAHPICEICGENEATQVHHIVKFSSGKSNKEIEKLAYDYDNLMALCKNCHLSKHKKDYHEE